MNACCRGCRAPACSSPSMVVTPRWPTVPSLVMHERTASRSRSTVQAPHAAWPQPYFVPVRSSSSRSTDRRVRFAGAVTRRSTPLTRSLVAAIPRQYLLAEGSVEGGPPLPDPLAADGGERAIDRGRGGGQRLKRMLLNGVLAGRAGGAGRSPRAGAGPAGGPPGAPGGAGGARRRGRARGGGRRARRARGGGRRARRAPGGGRRARRAPAG